MTGNWISDDYLDILIQSKSPLKAQENSEAEFMFFPSNVTETFDVVYNFHEGESDRKLFRYEGQVYTIDYNETKTVFEFLPNNKLKIGNKIFTQVNKESKMNYKIPEKILFAGSYKLDGQTITFDEAGNISGWNKYKKYSVNMDYIGMYDVDKLMFNDDMENYRAFKFENNKLNFYEYVANEDVNPEDGEGYKAGKLLFSLEKIK